MWYPIGLPNRFGSVRGGRWLARGSLLWFECPAIRDLFEVADHLVSVTLTTCVDDALSWNWEANGSYSTHSYYAAIFTPLNFYAWCALDLEVLGLPNSKVLWLAAKNRSLESWQALSVWTSTPGSFPALRPSWQDIGAPAHGLWYLRWGMDFLHVLVEENSLDVGHDTHFIDWLKDKVVALV
jgi:hypothetical protein